MLKKHLELTDDQAAKISLILDDAKKQADALRDDTTIARKDKRAKFQEIGQDMHTQIRAILTPEQQQKLDEMKDHAGKDHGPGGPGGPNAGAPEAGPVPEGPPPGGK
jgi:Spy/CpxP family protein refolding chaperone